jgi:hypothetical protein
MRNHQRRHEKIKAVKIKLRRPSATSTARRDRLLPAMAVKSHPTPTPRLARKNAPSDVAETGGAEPQIAEQSRSWRAAIGEREVMRGS